MASAESTTSKTTADVGAGQLRLGHRLDGVGQGSQPQAGVGQGSERTAI